MNEATATETVRRLNDCLRRSMVLGGNVLLTTGVAHLAPERLTELLALVRAFDKFTPDNDPHGEHDFGAIEVDAERYFFKIDYYDLSCTAGSPDPADPAVTTRVMTIMRADEY